MKGPVATDPLAERVARLFGKACRLQVAALPWRIDQQGLRILLITSRDSGRWVLPKGWPEANEAYWDAAAREANEEAGLTGAVSSIEIGRYFYAKMRSSGQRVPCQVIVYPLRVDKLADAWLEMEERRRQWFSPAQAALLVREPDLGELIALFGTDPKKFAA